MQRDLRILYMGTPDFAVLPLENLIKHGYNIVGVVTAPDKPAGRGQQVRCSPVKTYAQTQHLPIFQPTNLKSPDFIQTLQELDIDLIVVIAFRMLPKMVWELPKYGTINIHASLLPQYRGAAPINWAIVQGEEYTGVTSFFINETIDTGNIILQKQVTISPTATAGELHDILMVEAANLLNSTIEHVKQNPSASTPQESIHINSELKHAPKITKETCKIDWNTDAKKIFNHIRGFSPYPGAWCIIEKQNSQIFCKIYYAEFENTTHNMQIGTIVSDKLTIKIACKDGYILPTDIQLEGKKRMSISDCLRGYSFENAIFI